MAYKEVMEEYLKREKNYNDTLSYNKINKAANFNNLNTECATGNGYSAAATALADFVYGFPNGFTISNRDEYIHNTQEIISSEIQKTEDYDTKIYYKVYLQMLNKLADINDSDFRKLIYFVTKRKRIEDKELARKDDGFGKAQTKALNEIYEMFESVYNNADIDRVFFHVGTTEEEKNAIIQKNRHKYILLRNAILNGFESTTSMTDEEFNGSIIETFSDMGDKEMEEYYRKPFNTVSSLTKKRKSKLSKKMSKKIIK